MLQKFDSLKNFSLISKKIIIFLTIIFKGIIGTFFEVLKVWILPKTIFQGYHEENTLIFYITWRLWLASKAVPGWSTKGVVTLPASTHSMFGHSSGPKSGSSLAFSAHGFQTTVSGKLYFCIRIFLPDTTFVIMCSCAVFL